jgi:hypothetical protein
VVAPDPVNVALDPEQIADEDVEAETVGAEFTVKLTVCVLLHPEALVPFTVYTVVEAGLTLTAEPVREPGNHV